MFRMPGPSAVVQSPFLQTGQATTYVVTRAYATWAGKFFKIQALAGSPLRMTGLDPSFLHFGIGLRFLNLAAMLNSLLPVPVIQRVICGLTVCGAKIYESASLAGRANNGCQWRVNGSVAWLTNQIVGKSLFKLVLIHHQRVNLVYLAPEQRKQISEQHGNLQVKRDLQNVRVFTSYFTLRQVPTMECASSLSWSAAIR